MPGQVAPITDERELLIGYIAQQRDAIRFAAFGITDEQARQRLTASELTLGGLVKHVAAVERNWIRMLAPVAGEQLRPEDWMSYFVLGHDETLGAVLAMLDDVGKDTEEVVRGLASLDVTVPVPQDMPWNPRDAEWSARWILLHLIEELGRHAGHADILRESLDGRTAMHLMAEAEGWLPTLQRWMSAWQ